MSLRSILFGDAPPRRHITPETVRAMNEASTPWPDHAAIRAASGRRAAGFERLREGLRQRGFIVGRNPDGDDDTVDTALHLIDEALARVRDLDASIAASHPIWCGCGDGIGANATHCVNCTIVLESELEGARALLEERGQLNGHLRNRVANQRKALRELTGIRDREIEVTQALRADEERLADFLDAREVAAFDDERDDPEIPAVDRAVREIERLSSEQASSSARDEARCTGCTPCDGTDPRCPVHGEATETSA
jgi:hypothetical protein